MALLLFICVPAAFILAIGLRASARSRAADPTRCVECRYPRVGLAVSVPCPECATVPGQAPPPRPRLLAAAYVLLVACPLLVTLFDGLLVADAVDATAEVLIAFTWTLAAVAVGWPLRIAERHLRPRHALVLAACAVLPFVGVLTFLVIYCNLIRSGSVPSGQDGPVLDIDIWLGLAGPVLAANSGAWAFFIAGATIAIRRLA